MRNAVRDGPPLEVPPHRLPRAGPRMTRGPGRSVMTAMRRPCATTPMALLVAFAPACFARAGGSGAAELARRPALGAAAAAGRIELARTAAMHVLRGGAASGDSPAGDAGGVPGLRKRARRLAKTGDWGGAADVYGEAIALLTGEPSAATGSSEAAAGEAGAGDTAAAALQSCRLNHALCCLKAERLDDAVAACTAALKAEPGCGIAHFRRGQARTRTRTRTRTLTRARTPTPTPALVLALALALTLSRRCWPRGGARRRSGTCSGRPRPPPRAPRSHALTLTLTLTLTLSLTRT